MTHMKITFISLFSKSQHKMVWRYNILWVVTTLPAKTSCGPERSHYIVHSAQAAWGHCSCFHAFFHPLHLHPSPNSDHSFLLLCGFYKIIQQQKSSTSMTPYIPFSLSSKTLGLFFLKLTQGHALHFFLLLTYEIPPKYI